MCTSTWGGRGVCVCSYMYIICTSNMHHITIQGYIKVDDITSTIICVRGIGKPWQPWEDTSACNSTIKVIELQYNLSTVHGGQNLRKGRCLKNCNTRLHCSTEWWPMGEQKCSKVSLSTLYEGVSVWQWSWHCSQSYVPLLRAILDTSSCMASCNN